jgi:hypothetical protein
MHKIKEKMMNPDINNLPFFPNPAQGETVYSIMCRVQTRSGLQEKIILEALTGQQKKAHLLSPLPGYLKILSQSLPDGHPWCDNLYIWSNHTTLPYFLYFDPPNLRDQWLQKLQNAANCQPFGLALGLTTYKGQALVSNPRYCPQCAKRQMEKFGFTYFQREHQLPWVFVCWKHNTPLSIGCAKCGAYPFKKNGLIMPGRCFCDKGAAFLPSANIEPSIRKQLYWLAQQSAYMVQSNGTKAKDVRVSLKACLKNNGFCRGKSMMHEPVASAIQDRFGEKFLSMVGYPAFKGDRESAWIRMLLINEGTRKRRPVIKYMLLIGAIFGSIAEFEGCIKNGQYYSNTPEDDHEVPSSTISDNITEQIVSLAKAGELGVRTIALKFGLKDAAVCSILIEQKIRLPLPDQAIKKLGQEKLDRIRQAIANGLDRKKIVQDFNISPWTYRNIVLDQPELYEVRNNQRRAALTEQHRNIILDLVRKKPDITRSDIWHRYTGTYQYMKTYDQDWFDSTVAIQPRRTPTKPRSKRRDWQQVDRQLAATLKDLIADCSGKSDKPVWINETSMLRKLKSIIRYKQNQSQLPEVTKLLEQSVESHDAFLERKIKWAIEQFGPNELISVNVLRRKAGLRARVLRRFKDVVIEHADKVGGKIHGRSFFRK